MNPNQDPSTQSSSDDESYAPFPPGNRLAHQLEGLLWPERFPPGHDRHDHQHPFWAGYHEEGDFFEWSSDTIEWVADLVEKELELTDEPSEEAKQTLVSILCSTGHLERGGLIAVWAPSLSGV